MAVLLKFCSEGDNIPDAFGLVNYLNEWLQLIKIRVSAVCFRAFIFYYQLFSFSVLAGFALACGHQEQSKRKICFG